MASRTIHSKESKKEILKKTYLGESHEVKKMKGQDGDVSRSSEEDPEGASFGQGGGYVFSTFL